MELFKYKALDGQGNRISGEITASNLSEAERKIAAKDVTVIAILPAGAVRNRGASESVAPTAPKGRRKVSEAEAAATLDNLALMVKTGVPFVEALEAVAASARSPVMAEALRQIKEDVIGGQSLSGAMRATSGVFPTMVADMVRVAEEGGRLDLALRSASAYLERSADLRRRVLNAMMYPCVMLGVSFITVLVLVLFVIPRFATIFTKSGVQVPVTTQAMISLSAAVHNNPWACIATFVAIVAGGFFLIRLDFVRAPMGRLLFRTPVIGPLLRHLAISRAVQSIATLLSSNVPLMAALEHGSKVAAYPPVGDALMKARNDVEHGTSLSDSLGDSSVFPPMLLQLVHVGERTGQLSSLLQSGSESMESEIDARLKALVAIVEPLMIVGMGVIVGGITLSIITPIYNVVQNIK